MAKPIKSTDPRKPTIVTALKARSKCRKVTMVEELSPGLFQGNCMYPNQGGVEGLYQVDVEFPRASLRKAPEPPPERSGAETLRIIVSNMNATREGFNDRFTVDELIRIYTAQLASGWDFYPDQWTDRQVKEALGGKVPQWDDSERPIYA